VAQVTRDQLRRFGGGWAVNADLPTPAGFDGATQFVRREAQDPFLKKAAEPLLEALRAAAN
jgi:hypothetical protein